MTISYRLDHTQEQYEYITQCQATLTNSNGQSDKVGTTPHDDGRFIAHAIISFYWPGSES